MSRDNFDDALAAVLIHEGGYVNDPRDPGGATNKGVTQAVYDDWRQGHHLPAQSVKGIAPVEVTAIYKHRYWDALKGDSLPTGLDYCLFDFAVNSGVSRAARYFQRSAGVTEDGQIGPATLKAASASQTIELIDAVCDLRLAFLRHLGSFNHFGKGWTMRVTDVRAKAKAMTRI